MKAIEEFLEQIRSGDRISEAVFVEVYNQIYRWFNRYVYARCNEDYSEIINEAITRFLEKKENFRGNTMGEFYLYFKSIIKSVLYLKNNRKSSSDIELNVDYSDSRSNPDAECVVNEELDALYNCIDNLPDKPKSMIAGVLIKRKKKDI